MNPPYAQIWWCVIYDMTMSINPASVINTALRQYLKFLFVVPCLMKKLIGNKFRIHRIPRLSIRLPIPANINRIPISAIFLISFLESMTILSFSHVLSLCVTGSNTFTIFYFMKLLFKFCCILIRQKHSFCCRYL